jgi:hypothetical protein
MRKILLAATAALVIGAAGTGALIRAAEAQRDRDAALDIASVDVPDMTAAADPAWSDPDLATPGQEIELAQADMPPPGPPGGPPPMARRMPPPWMHAGGGPGWERRRGEMMRTFALFFRPEDRALTPPEVQKIAEAFLLWNGNRTWKVTEVTATTDGKVSFAYATSDGGVIARFAMDTKTGRVRRTA